jgi:hypothetical protein
MMMNPATGSFAEAEANMSIVLHHRLTLSLVSYPRSGEGSSFARHPSLRNGNGIGDCTRQKNLAEPAT